MEASSRPSLRIAAASRRGVSIISLVRFVDPTAFKKRRVRTVVDADFRGRYGYPMTRPRIAITLGDPTGVGPEIAAAVLDHAASRADVIVFGQWPSPTGAALSDRAVAEAQLGALELAIDAALAGRCDAIVTAPISKASVAEISPGFTGHTGHLAARCGLHADDVTMVFASDTLAVGLVATHVPLRDVPGTITEARCERALRHVVQVASALRPGRALRIAVAALNPHAGEDGLLGTEERDVLVPFCRAARVRGLDVSDPIPADAVFRDALAGAYDGVISMYHDQAMIPLKLAGFGRTANVTVGLPFVRTSPDHGVARDLAGTGRADPSGMRLAVDIAVELVEAGRCGGAMRP
jgi:4-hydroxythreonine-4-phosphate dehydrogenase